MKTILIPTDFSYNAWNAIEYAFNMFGKDSCSFILLNTYYAAPPAHDAISISYYDPLAKSSKEGLKNELAQIKEKLDIGNAKIECIHEYGEPANVIRKLLDQRDIDLVIMGTQGASGLKQVLIGSNTASVINSVKCPVLAIPENAKYYPLKKIVFAADYKPLKDERILDPLKQLSKKHQSEVLILNVIAQDKQFVTVEEGIEGFELHNLLEKEVEHSFHSINEKEVEKGIDQFAHENNADIVVLLKRKHSFFEKLFSKSVTKQMAFHSDIPLLVLHE